MTTLGVDVQLERFPPTKNASLRAWDAADEYVLDYLAERAVGGGRWLVVNDSHGALSVGLNVHRPDSVTDSVATCAAISRNLAHNGLAADAVGCRSVLEPLAGVFDVVVIKVPKTLALLEDELHRLRPHLGPSTVIVGAGMVKQIHTSTLDLFERIVGPTTTSLAKKKARLIHPSFDGELATGDSPYPTAYTTDDGVNVVNHANVFSQARLDIGTRFLLEHLPVVADGSDVVDLGCGNGVVGTALARTFDGGSLCFTDVSFMAVASAAATYEATLGSDGRATFEAIHVLDGVPSGCADLVVINPPFHNEHVVGDETAWRMFSEARRVLRPGGEVRVVGNRHLGYHAKLKRLFGNSDTVASNKKFVILRAVR